MKKRVFVLDINVLLNGRDSPPDFANANLNSAIKCLYKERLNLQQIKYKDLN